MWSPLLSRKHDFVSCDHFGIGDDTTETCETGPTRIWKRDLGFYRQLRAKWCLTTADYPTRKERIRDLVKHFHLLKVLSWAAQGGDAVCGKLVNEIVGVADVINDLYADPDPCSQESGSCGTTFGADCDCRRAQRWT